MNALLRPDGSPTRLLSRVTRGVWLAGLLVLAAQSLAAVTITSNTTITEGDTTYDGEDLIVKGATVAIDGPHSFSSIQVVNGGVLTHSPCTATATHKLELNVAGTVVVDETSKIDVSGLGYLAGRTSGNTTVGGATVASGGSYGGLGGQVAGRGGPNRVYGDYANPEDWGSGGGGQIRESAGGGLVRLVAGTLRLDGKLAANGVGIAWNGGSGGEIYVAVGTLEGNGAIEAKGGVNSLYGCGGGGRVAVYAQDWSVFALANITAAGGAGTEYVRKPGEVRGTLVVDAGGGRGEPSRRGGAPGHGHAGAAGARRDDVGRGRATDDRAGCAAGAGCTPDGGRQRGGSWWRVAGECRRAHGPGPGSGGRRHAGGRAHRGTLGLSGEHWGGDESGRNRDADAQAGDRGGRGVGGGWDEQD